MISRSHLEGYLLEIVARSRSAQDRCSTLLAYDFISKSPGDLARAISRLCDFLARAAISIFSQIDWEDLDENDVLLLRNADFLIQQWAAHLRYVQGSRTDRLPWGIVPSFERLAERLVPGKQVMLRPKWNYNYTVTLSDIRAAYLTSLDEFRDYMPGIDIEGDVLRDLRQPFHIIAFPSLERENILLHTLLGHELGHLFADRFLTKERGEAFKASVMAQVEVITDQELQRAVDSKSTGTLFHVENRKAHIAYNIELALDYWTRALEELLSDVVGAILFGPAALFSTLEMAVQERYDLPPSPETNFYPPWRMRLREVLRIVEMGDPFFPLKASLFRSDDASARADRVNESFATIKRLCAERSDVTATSANPIARLAYTKVESGLKEAIEFFLTDCKLGRKENYATPRSVFKNMAVLVDRLDHDIPPNALGVSVNDRSRIGLVEIINAAWIHKASQHLPALVSGGINEALLEKRKRANRLTLKAIEFAGLATDYWRSNKVEDYVPKDFPKETPRERREGVGGQREEEVEEQSGSAAGTLSAFEIVSAMEREVLGQRLIITPLLNPDESCGAGAIDVRLGNQFIIMKREAFPLLDIGKSDTIDVDIERYQERIIKPYGESFILHPRQLVIGSTLEYIQLPADLMCYVIGKSTWGRMGLIIATATKVDPGFRGCVTLEIINEGEIPIVLYPGVPIAQLVLHRASGKSMYEGGYSCAIGPEFPKFKGKRVSWKYWTRQ